MSMESSNLCQVVLERIFVCSQGCWTMKTLRIGSQSLTRWPPSILMVFIFEKLGKLQHVGQSCCRNTAGISEGDCEQKVDGCGCCVCHSRCHCAWENSKLHVPLFEWQNCRQLKPFHCRGISKSVVRLGNKESPAPAYESLVLWWVCRVPRPDSQQ